MIVYCVECWNCKYAIVKNGEFCGCENSRCKYKEKTE